MAGGIAAAGAPRWISWWFRGAAVFGLVALLPQYLLPQPTGAELVALSLIHI